MPSTPLDFEYDPLGETPGYVYVARLTFRGYVYKIGRSARPHVRLAQLSLPGPIECVHTIATNATKVCERVLLKEREKYRLRGEWFELSPSELVKLLLYKRIEFRPPDCEPHISIEMSRIPALSYINELRRSDPYDQVADLLEIVDRLCPTS